MRNNKTAAFPFAAERISLLGRATVQLIVRLAASSNFSCHAHSRRHAPATVCLFKQQVDDLQSIDALEEYIYSSAVVTIFASLGYFLSKNCMREVHATVNQNKPLCLVFDPVRGGAPLQDVEDECGADLRPKIFGHGAAKRDVIVWHRIKDVCLYSQELPTICSHTLALNFATFVTLIP